MENINDSFGYRLADPTVYPLLRDFAKRMRAVPTHAENLLWQALRAKKLDGHKFRRQHIISRYICDFVCLRCRLIIEIDGLIHQLPENQQSDAEREEALAKLGFRVIRFTNEDIRCDLDQTLKKIASLLESISSSATK